jgi:hypothetical protein
MSTAVFPQGQLQQVSETGLPTNAVTYARNPLNLGTRMELEAHRHVCDNSLQTHECTTVTSQKVVQYIRSYS